MIKIFENGTTTECLKRCLDDGYRPMTTMGIVKAKKENKIKPEIWYDTSTFFNLDTGEIKDLSIKELRSVLSGKLRGRVLFVNGSCGGLCGISLNNVGRFVGEKK